MAYTSQQLGEIAEALKMRADVFCNDALMYANPDYDPDWELNDELMTSLCRSATYTYNMCIDAIRKGM